LNFKPETLNFHQFRRSQQKHTHLLLPQLPSAFSNVESGTRNPKLFLTLNLSRRSAFTISMPAASHVYRTKYVMKIRLRLESYLPVPQNISINIQILRICFCNFELLILWGSIRYCYYGCAQQ